MALPPTNLLFKYRRRIGYALLFSIAGALLCLVDSETTTGAVDSVTRKRDEIAALTARHAMLQTSLFHLKNRLEALADTIATDGPSRDYDPANVCEGRLTTETGVPLSTTDQAEVATIYYTPYEGYTCALINGSAVWQIVTFTEKSTSVASATSGKNYDVFGYLSSNTLALELSSAWADDQTRTDALTQLNGVLVKSSDNTRRYLGTIRASSGGKTIDSSSQRFVWNYQNRLPRFLYVKDTTNTWTYVTNGWRAANNTSTNRVQYVIGVDKTLKADAPVIHARAMVNIRAGAANLNYYAVGIGLDTTAVNAADIIGTGGSNVMTNQVWGEYRGYQNQGGHSMQWLERADGTSGYTVWGDNGSTNIQSGMLVEIEG